MGIPRHVYPLLVHIAYEFGDALAIFFPSVEVLRVVFPPYLLRMWYRGCLRHNKNSIRLSSLLMYVHNPNARRYVQWPFWFLDHILGRWVGFLNFTWCVYAQLLALAEILN